MSEAPEFFFTTPRDFLATAADHTPGAAIDRLFVRPSSDRSKPRRKPRSRRRNTKRFFPAANSFSTFCGDGQAFGFHAGNRCLHPGHVPTTQTGRAPS